MANVSPTTAQLKARFPAFAAVPDATVDLVIVEANRMVDDTWTAGDYQMAIMLMACHIMTMDGLGTGGEAGLFASGTSEFQSVSSGTLSLTRFNRLSTDTVDPYDLLGVTSYGRRFGELLRRNKLGPVVATLGPGAVDGASWPPPGWWGH